MRRVAKPGPGRPAVFAYNPGLDGVRAFAVLGVMVGHAGLSFAGEDGRAVLWSPVAWQRSTVAAVAEPG